jgi:hypothetical protein
MKLAMLRQGADCGGWVRDVLGGGSSTARRENSSDDKDEAIFVMAGDDRGGYALDHDDFRKVAMVSWIYH